MLIVFELEDVSDEPDECDMSYEKVGCFEDKTNARALSVRIFSDRKNIDWEAGKWEKFLKRQVFTVQHACTASCDSNKYKTGAGSNVHLNMYIGRNFLTMEFNSIGFGCNQFVNLTKRQPYCAFEDF